MKEVYLQYWEESERGWGVRPDGCSIHINMEEHKKYINLIYNERENKEVPYEYDRVIGETISVFVKDDLYDLLVKENTIRLFKHQLSNLLKLEEITII